MRTTKEQCWPGQIEVKCQHCPNKYWCYPSDIPVFCSHSCRAIASATPRTDPQLCRTCEVSKPLSEFIKTKNSHTLICRECRRPSPEQERRAHLKQKFGMTLEQWFELYELQGCACAICTKPLPTKTEILTIANKTDSWTLKDWNTDHCHITGKVRGILCRKCNAGLGAFNDDPIKLEQAADYMEKHNG